MAKDNKDTVEVEDLEDLVDDDEESGVEVEETEEAEGTRPKDLAAELDINPKALRAFLRREFPRGSTEKNTSWYLTDTQVEAARNHFAPEDDEEETEETVEVEA